MGFHRSDRRILVLLFAVVIAAWGGILIDRWLLRPQPSLLATLDEVAMDTLSARNQPASTASYALDADDAAPQPETFTFDPNTADSTALLRLGLAPWQVKGIYKYRARGGRYHRPEDFKRVPGMTPEVYDRLAPYIAIDRAFRYYDAAELRADRAPQLEHEAQHQQLRDSIAALSRPEKFTELTVVELNSADTTLLKRIPGIASYRARQIVRYRERLGGYVSTAQLGELDRFPAEELMEWFRVAPDSHRRIHVNEASMSEMGNHPYIGFARARAIEKYRHTHGTIKNINELRLLPDFSEEDITRMAPYLAY